MTTSTLRLDVFGVPIDVEVPAERLAALRRQWSWCLPTSPTRRSVPGIGGVHVAVEPGRLTRPAQHSDVDGHIADYRLTTSVTAQAIATCSGRFLMLHAAGVADTGTGRVAGLVAPSGTGKTTAAHLLCSAGGFGYVTDETLVINDAGQIAPYPKPLSVVLDGERHGKSQHGPDEMGLTPPPAGELRLGPLVVLERSDDVRAPSVERLSPIEGLLALLPQSSATPRLPAGLDLIAELARRGGGFWRLRYREIADAVPQLREVMSAEEAPREWTHVPGHQPGDTALDAPAVPDEPLSTATRLTRAPFLDAVLSADGFEGPNGPEGLVLVGDVPILLAGIGVLCWTELARPKTVAQLTQVCVAAFGHHPDAEALVLGALVEMERSGLVVRAGRDAARGESAPPS